MQSPTFELGFSVVRAGAGAGKTWGLVEKVIAVYRKGQAQGEAGPRIVLTTFTRKATQELKERLMERAVAEKDTELLQFVTDSTRLHISTIHGLLNLFLKQVGHLAGLDSGFQIINEQEGRHMARMALREVLVTHPEALRWLEVYGFERMLDMCRRYQTLKREQGEVVAATVADIMTAIRLRTKYWQEQFRPLIQEITRSTNEESWVRFAQALEACVKSWDDSLPNLENLPSKPRRSKKQVEFEALHEVVEKPLTRFKDELKEPFWNADLWLEMTMAWEQFGSFAQHFTRELQLNKDNQARFEMNDLELKSLEILRANPFLAGVFSEAWDFWMIDEYQDTSPLQVAILKMLIGTKPKYLVGDPQQSIYLFRGAEASVFSAAEKEISEAGGETIELIKNYRSSPDLLMWVNDFMASLGDSFLRMQPREEVKPTKTAAVTLFRAPDAEVELKGIVAQVHQLLEAGSRLEEICIISRTHRGLMEVSQVLKAHGYPTHVHAARGFTTRREVVDAQALWKFLVNPHDNLSLLILLRSPWFFIEDWQLAEWMKDRPASLWRRLVSLTEVPGAIGRLRECQSQQKTEGMVRAFERALTQNAFLDFSLANDPAGRKESNLWKLIHKAQTLEKEGGSSILELMQAASDNPLDASEGDATSAQEPNCINLMTIHGSKGLEFDHVIVPRMGETPVSSTTPSLFAEDGIYFFPIWNEEEGRFVSSPLDFNAIKSRREREMEEFDRWLYVALTRAKKTLTLCWSSDGRDSWVKRSPWFTKPVGLFAGPAYTYQVVEAMPESKPYRLAESENSKVRPEFQKIKEKTTERFSVSELVEGDVKISTGDMLKRWQAQSAGSRIHLALEALKYGGLDAKGTQDDEAVRYVLELKDPPLAEWISRGFTEWGFQVETPSGVVEGQIDLWAKVDGKLFVIDYKSGSKAGVESAFKQLSLYAWALRKFGHKEPATLVVVYPLLKKTESRPFSEELFLGWEVKLSRT